ncbi:beta-N-acetylhexosaminidase [Propionibacteriaceae bacterium ES.041]|uniref:glycoside hydrolase family 3 protein n=1 Tax=Enemella evansiae TaxID=2016499 RepID=UPI000B96BD80|nr:glycoside hydrolase family 3 protein [Enemella evansiae]OYN99029.1 beta-N-acetylhexosaminidase [Enemella evansiae]PFG67443.1 beta-N-acetylhexosaminidase [Propionibacteriaceae bacterium ES.041]
MIDNTFTRRTLLAGLGATALAGSLCARQAYAAPPPGNPNAINGWVNSTLARMTREQKIGQLFVQEVYGSDSETPDQRNVANFGEAVPARIVEKYQLGGVIYFAWTDSFKNPQQVARLSNGLQQAALRSGGKVQIPLQVATDQEQGVVTRFGPPATQFPGSMALGAGRSTADARVAAEITGAELRAVGINVDFAPCSDVNVNPLNPVIGVRSFGSNPAMVAEMVAAQIDGYQLDGKVSSSTKHFPGHGDTATDSHTGLPIITHTREQWEQIDAPPFRAAIARGVDMVMTAHLVMPAFDDSGDPATLSKPVITGLLRGELGYDGVVITDALTMQGVREKYGDAEVAVRALEAGVDQLLMCPAIQPAIAAINEALGSGRLTEADLDAKVRRILRMKFRRGMVAQPLADIAAINGIVGTAAHQATAAKVSDRTVTLVKNDAKALPLKPAGSSILVTGYGVSTTQVTADELAKRGATARAMQTGTSPSDATIASVVAAAQSVDTVIVLTNKAWDTAVTDKTGGQQKLVKQLLATGKTIIVVAVRDPYDIAYFDQAPTYVATYSYSPVTPPSLVRVLTGEVNPQGKLPVDIPVAGAPQTVLYPYGHGLSY